MRFKVTKAPFRESNPVIGFVNMVNSVPCPDGLDADTAWSIHKFLANMTCVWIPRNKTMPAFNAADSEHVLAAMASLGSIGLHAELVDESILNSFEGHEGRIGMVGGSLPKGERFIPAIPKKALEAAKLRVKELNEYFGARLKKIENLSKEELMQVRGVAGALAVDLWREKSGMGTSNDLLFARGAAEAENSKLVRRWAKIYRQRGVDEVTPEFHAIATKGADSFYNSPAMQPIFDKFGKVPVVTCTKDDWNRDIPQARYEGQVIEVFDGTSHWWGQSLNADAFTTTAGGINIPDKSLIGVIHHEYGHHVQGNLRDEQNPVIDEFSRAWSEYKSSYDADYKKAANPDGTWKHECRDVEKTRLSDYSLSKCDEGFAETFAAVTAPDYNREKYSSRCHPMLELMEKIIK